jgi:hypothetical protein
MVRPGVGADDPTGAQTICDVQSDAAFPKSSGSFAMLMAIRRASSAVSTSACRASASVSRL